MKIAAYDDDGIWGVGDTQEQADAEADGFLREAASHTINDVLTLDEEAYKSMKEEIKFAPVSDDYLERALADDPDTAEGATRITINYSDYPFMLNEDGVLVFDEDKAEANEEDGVTEFIEGDDEEEEDATGVPAGTIDQIADSGHAVDPDGEGDPNTGKD
jgi:hypothetical protein